MQKVDFIDDILAETTLDNETELIYKEFSNYIQDEEDEYNTVSKRVDYQLAISIPELEKAAKLCRKTVSWKDSVAVWTHKRHENCNKLRHALLTGNYKISKYVSFMISEPKPRVIFSTRFTDRVFQRSLCNNGLYYLLTRRLIADNPACRLNMGTDYTINRLKGYIESFMAKNNDIRIGYYVKLDIHNYFASIPHNLLKEDVAELIEDPMFRFHTNQVIDSFAGIFVPSEEEKQTYHMEEVGVRGLGLGSQISQLLALVYLNKFDHLVKEQWKVPYYIRYMDDMIFLCRTRQEAEDIFRKSIEFISKNRKLPINPKSHIAQFRYRQPIEFMKKRFLINKAWNGVAIRKNKKSIGVELNRISHYMKCLRDKTMSLDEVVNNLKGWMGASRKYLSKHQYDYVMRYIKTQFNEKVLASLNEENSKY